MPSRPNSRRAGRDQERDQRERTRADEEAARLVSEAIDRQLQAEKAAHAKHAAVVKILLLGQSESGKSTVLKNFQLLYAKDTFIDEQASWRGVILLNVVRSMLKVVDAISQVDLDEDGPDSADESFPDAPPALASLITDRHRRLCSSIRPSLIEAEEILRGRISQSGHISLSSLPRPRPSSAPPMDQDAETEVFVRSRAGWHGPLREAPEYGFHMAQRGQQPFGTFVRDGGIDTTDPTDPVHIVYVAREDMIALWSDRVVHEILRRKKMRWHEWPGFFLEDLRRVTELDYVPTGDDVVRARLKTLGVSEYSFVTSRAGLSSLWRIFDVGGSRTQRHTWIPFFDDCQAIIFLAPIGAFDQKLAEDRSVNRLEDSLLLWKDVCANKLLAKVDFILFLNKVDVLRAKLDAGVKIVKYVRSYRDRPNTVDAATHYFKDKFHAIQREYSPELRPFYCFCTNAINTKDTKRILASVGDSILRSNLANAQLV